MPSRGAAFPLKSGQVTLRWRRRMLRASTYPFTHSVGLLRSAQGRVGASERGSRYLAESHVLSRAPRAQLLHS